MKTRQIGILLLLLALTGCVKETLDPCPEGRVHVDVYAEKFQTHSAAAGRDAEEHFNTRIQYMHGILFKGDTYVMDTLLDATSASNSSYGLDFSNLGFGDYQLVLVGNCAPEAMTGDLQVPGGLTLLYSGVDQTDDLFAALLNFTVDCDCPLQFATKLRRLQGVVRCRLINVPAEISEAEVILQGANSRLGKGGLYSQPVNISKRIALNSQNNTETDIILGAFPNLSGRPVAYELKLYTPQQPEAVFDRVLSTEVNIKRNDLVELVTDFSNGSLRFEINVDRQWGDPINGGEVEVH